MSLGAEVTAVDADSSLVAVAAGLVPGVKFQVAALPALPFDPDCNLALPVTALLATGQA
jgi:hypothetical protein